MLRIKEIWLDNKREPVGTQGFPSFRWVMESDKKNVMQSAYSFVVREAHSDRMIYESGWVESARSVEVTPEEELDLRSLTKYSVRYVPGRKKVLNLPDHILLREF